MITANDLADFETIHATLVTYLKHKVQVADWHGVSDAANDLRVLEAAHDGTRFAHPIKTHLLCGALSNHGFKCNRAVGHEGFHSWDLHVPVS